MYKILLLILCSTSLFAQDTLGDQYTKFRRGDVNGNGNLDTNDIIRFNLEGQRVSGLSDWTGTGPWTSGWGTPADRFDVDDDGDIDWVDYYQLVILVFLKQGTTPPLPIWPLCYDPTPDLIDKESDYPKSLKGVSAWINNPYFYRQKYYGDILEWSSNDGTWNPGVLDWGFYNGRTGTLSGYGLKRECQKFEHRTMIYAGDPIGAGGVNHGDWTRALITNNDFDMHFKFDFKIELNVSGNHTSCSINNVTPDVNEIRVDTSGAFVVFFFKTEDGISKGVVANFDQLRNIGPNDNGLVRLLYREQYLVTGGPWFGGSGCYLVDVDNVSGGSADSANNCSGYNLTRKWPQDFLAIEWDHANLTLTGQQLSDALGLAGVGLDTEWYLESARLWGVNFIYHKYEHVGAVQDSLRGDNYEDLGCTISAQMKFKLTTVPDYAWGLTTDCPE